ncbi:MAG TPA: cytochrome c biogenesis protein CcsA [Anaeromyxobacter sp.]|nr:cytochrome c biogenesis protein CcsA [Anaeromyxobacter sp.]
MKLEKILPWAAAAVAVLLVGISLRPARGVNGFDLAGFGQLPVLEGGRVKPLDSVARNALLMLRQKSSLKGEVAGADGATAKVKLTASEWLLDVLFRPARADAYPAFVVDDPDMLALLGVEQKGSRTYARFQDLLPHLDDVERQAMIQPTDNDQRRVQRAAQNLAERASLYGKLKVSLQLPGTTLADELGKGGAAAARNLQAMDQFAQFRPLPPAAGAKPTDWRTVGRGLAAVASGQRDPILEGWASLGKAWTAGDAGAFNAAVASIAQHVRAANPAGARQGVLESLFNRADPFFSGFALYMLALLSLFVSWLARPAAFRSAALVLLVAGAVVQTVGIVARVVLQGYPPVTNLYSSAVVVGWVAVVVGILLEVRYRRGFGTLAAATVGAATLIIAQNLATSGDTMEMMRAVLDSNFWLATHVITIVIGYAGTYLAGFLAIAATAYRHLAPNRDRRDDRLLGSMIYGVVCFALFFSFVGTVLGGIWADQSWGRFWGWDPKENGALLIVLWTAIILHARWGGYVRERGIAAMAIFGNVITSLSWFGVNMLGVGLHSYGFMDAATFWLATFCGSQLLLMGVALLPERFWKAESWRASREPSTHDRATPAVHGE